MSLIRRPHLAAPRMTRFRLVTRSASGRGRRRRRGVRRRLTQALSVALVVAMLATPAAAQVTVGTAGRWRESLALWMRHTGLSARIEALLSGAQGRAPARQAAQSARDGRVARVQISPGDVTITEGEQVDFAARAFDSADAPVGGVRFKWQAFHQERNRPVRMRDGRFVGRSPGTYRVVAEAARQQQAAVTVRVLPDDGRRRSRGEPGVESTVSSRDVPPEVSSRDERPARKRDSARRARGGGGVRFVKASTRGSAAAAAAEPAAPLIDPEAGWDGGNGGFADDPGNRVGDPPGTPPDDGAGSGNFQISAPVLGLAGRRQNVSLALSYNSHLWNKTKDFPVEYTFDPDRGWPAPGWALGFGKIVGMNQKGSMIVDPDGTRRSFTCAPLTISGSSTTCNGRTVDGSFIDYWTQSWQGQINWAWARHPDGTLIDYGAPANGAIYPVRITDANGNYVTITYRNNRGPEIESIIDTANRVISFHYDAANLLTAITAPDLGSGSRTLVRLQYQAVDLQPGANYGFAGGITPRVRDSAPQMLRAIYYPGTGTGYWFGDPDSYSSYGMIAKALEHRGMAFSGPAPVPAWQGTTGQGSISPGTMSQQLVYNYPMAPASLGDSPTYTTASLSWAHMDTPEAVTSYFVQKNATNPSDPNTPSQKSEVTAPNGTKNVQYSYRLPGDFKDGLIYQDDTFDGGGTLLARSRVTWEKGAYDSPRPTRIEQTDERGQTLKTEYSYGSVYNQTVEVRHYDYDGVTLLKRVVTAYENSSNYTSRHIFNLTLAVDTYGNDGVRASRVEYEYDNAPLAAAPGVVSHDPSHDPHNTEMVESGQCCRYEYDPWIGYEYCVEYCLVPVFNPATNYRGLVTKITAYTNAAAQPAAGAVAEARTYDITGNLVTTSSACCEQVSTAYTVNTQYMYPESRTRGSADPNSPHRVTTAATYDFNTGLDLTATDANGRVTQSVYYQQTLRPQHTILATGGRTTFEYDDVLMSVTETTTLSDGGPVAAKTVRRVNGLGLQRREEALGAGGAWDVIEVKYDQSGRVWQESRPFRDGAEQPQWSENFYDALGRVTRTVGPDGSETLTFFNEAARPSAAVGGGPPGQTTRAVDQWGRERWGRADAEGRLVEVVEPSPTGDGTVAAGGLLTTYAYDTLDNLVQVNQGAQQRRFRYDSLGRLTHQKLAEATATLNDAGQYVGPGGAGAQWSDTLAYDARSNLTARTEARGVTTTFAYNDDPLNRLQAVSYAVGAAHDTSSPIAAAATVNYEYMSTGDKTRPWKVTTQGVRQDWFAYDSEGRVSDVTMVIASRLNHHLTTSYGYDALDRVTDLTYPAQYAVGLVNPPRKVVHHDYDVASRLSGLQVNGVTYASEMAYDASSQATSVKVGSGSNWTREQYQYDPTTGLLVNQKVLRSGTTAILDLSYDYLRQGTTTGRTGHLTKITDHLNAQRGRTYSYDALGRLAQATGGNPAAAPLWTQVYTYDRYGNRETVTGSGTTASLAAPKDPAVKLPHVEVAAASTPPLPDFMRDGAARTTSDGPVGTPLYGMAAAGMPAAMPLLEAPSNLQVTSAADGQISLSWSANTGTGFRVERGTTAAGAYAVVGTPAATTFNDTGVSRGNAYLYRVCAANAANQCVSGFSRLALGTAVTFADPTLTAQSTPVRAQHFNDLRLAVNAVRRAAGLADAAWTDPTLTAQATVVRAVHVQELRTRLNEALAALNITVNPFTDPVLGTGAAGTLVKKTHVEELRQRAARGQSNSVVPPGAPVPTDGHASLSYDQATNRINSAGWQYDAAGNQIRAKTLSGVWQRMEYDAANRLVGVKTDAGALVAAYTYADSNSRMITHEAGARTYYAVSPAGVLAEYVEVEGTASAASPQWSKSYVYLRGRLLATQQPNTSGGEYVEYHHPDRLGTRLVTNNANTNHYEQVGLPFGAALQAESTGFTNRRFTSYDRSQATGLDYAVNRHYDSAQGRFTQVDPIEMQATSTLDPQTMNLYTYCGNDPVNHVDPDGLFFGKLWNFIKKAFRWILAAAAVALAILTIVFMPVIFPTVFKAVIGIIGAVAGAAQAVFSALGLNRLAAVFGIISAGTGFITSLQNLLSAHTWKNALKAIADGATLASRILAFAGHQKLGQIFGLVAHVANFMSSSLKDIKDKAGKVVRKFKPTLWETYKFIRGTVEQVATIAGETRIAGFANVLGLAEDAYTLYRGIKYFNRKEDKTPAGPGEDLGAPVKKWDKLIPQDQWEAANRDIRLRNRIDRLTTLIRRVNTAFGRVDRGIALAR